MENYNPISLQGGSSDAENPAEGEAAEEGPNARDEVNTAGANETLSKLPGIFFAELFLPVCSVCPIIN